MEIYGIYFRRWAFSGISEITDTQLQSPVSQIIAKLSNKLRDEKISSKKI